MIRALFNHRAIEVLENFRVPAFLYDPQNDMIYGNQQFSLISETLTLPEDRRKSSIINQLKNADNPSDLLFSTIEDSVSFQFTPVEVRSEGRRIWFCFMKSDDQKNSGFIMANLAHKKKLEELSEMASSIAHEINNPLTVVMAKTTMLERRLQEEEPILEDLLKDLEKIKSNSERIYRIVKGMRSFSRDASHDDLLPFSPQQAVDDAVSILGQALREKGILLHTSGKNQSQILGKPTQLTQVFTNLIQNAIHAIAHLPQGRIEILISEDEHNVNIYLKDNGKGVPKDLSEKIFQAFFTTKPPGEGTGLGLSVCKKILLDHNGDLKLASDISPSCFHLRLPIYKDRRVKDVG